MAEAQRLICAGAELADGSRGVRFDVPTAHGEKSGFVIRHRGRVYGYVNRCAHIGIEMDWRPGEFFDDSGLYLICATHGAVYRPETGECIAGPCRGARLEPVEVVEQDGCIYLK
ncbi:MAG: hypothetical protein EFKGCFLK_01797 [Rhodocyclaceae bacterium]|nr:MAG: Rieske 2Fe-2S domain-containing protein [Rhodocyclaceae bacterium]MBE7422104.1 Rieske 2Fe-2S domain-containing protein [Zoogloeaceae bacterium]MBV6408213.1 hypothetical protein [Rhodocyclaceae bacterium]MCK6383553.1 Rieske 2Fe-2S domain-containing protein [Rhodocyclaceae bacterium]CAG0927046.1 3-phenylpropionate/trans-cinnamate dioxygenase ferredoxin component [Rhodocyclaceae bacterium]